MPGASHQAEWRMESPSKTNSRPDRLRFIVPLAVIRAVRNGWASTEGQYLPDVRLLRRDSKRRLLGGHIAPCGFPPKRGRVGKTIGFGLHADHCCGQVGLLRIEDGELIDLTGIQLLLNDVEAGLRRLFRAPSCPHGARI